MDKNKKKKIKKKKMKMDKIKKQMVIMASDAIDYMGNGLNRQYRNTKRWTKRLIGTIKRWTKAYAASCIVTFIAFYLLPSATRKEILNFLAR